MAINYILEYGCQPKKLLGLAGVLEGSKLRHQAELFVASGAPADEPVQIVRLTADGRLDREELTPKQLRERSQGYEIHAGHCRGCPANVIERVTKHPQVFGCHGRVDQPLTAELEFLLYVTLRYIADKQLDTPRGRLLHFILESGLDGNTARNARENKPEEGNSAFAARESALSYTFQGPTGEVTIDTDQLLEALFFGERIEPEAAKFMYGPFFQTMEEMIAILIEQQGLNARKRLADPGIVQLRAFGTAVAISAELNTGILVEM